MRNGIVAATIAVSILATSCLQQDGKSPPPGPGFEATGATMEIRVPQGQIVARGDRMIIDRNGKEIVFNGNTRVELDGEATFEATARQLRVDGNGPVIRMNGNVKARFEVPSMAVGLNEIAADEN
jgi:hypothetical protein